MTALPPRICGLIFGDQTRKNMVSDLDTFNKERETKAQPKQKQANVGHYYIQRYLQDIILTKEHPFCLGTFIHIEIHISI